MFDHGTPAGPTATSARVRPGHGTRACYLRGCRRPECGQAHYRYMARYRLDVERGQDRRTDPAPAARHVQRLLDAGWIQARIAEAAGCGHRTVGDLLAGSPRSISRTTADRILAIPVSEPPPVRDFVDGTGTIRRIRALVAIGHPYAAIAAAVGLTEASLANIARGAYPKVRPATATATASAYRTLCRTPGPSARARSTAARHGWHGPMAWDEDIDDPTAEPETDTNPQITSRTEEAQAVAQDVRYLYAFNVSMSEIAARVGRSEKYIQQILAGARGPGWRDQLRTAV